MKAWRVGLRIRKIGTRDVVTLTHDLGSGYWYGRGPNGEGVALAQTDDWEPTA